MSNESLSAFRDVLRNAGLRATPARVAVLRILQKQNSPLSHTDVWQQLEDDGFDRATVYRNLTDLCEAGLAVRRDLGDHTWRYEMQAGGATHTNQSHPHFVCSDCGTVECLPEDAVSIQTASKSALHAEKLEIQLRGKCDDCN